MDFLEILGKNPVDTSKPWTLKYTPNSLSEIAGNNNIIESLNYYTINENIPNMIITGPTGVGKQTAVKCLLEKYLGQYREGASLIIHGSINRGKDVVSEKIEQKKNDKSYIGPNIMNFTKKKLSLPDNLCKIIVIYDFDKMTQEAQMALRRIIEIYSEKVRFIFTCNNISNIIEAIQSRCVILKFTKLMNDEIKTVLQNIAIKENQTISDDILDLICLAAYGDLKQAINYLQILSFSEKKDVNSFYKIFNMPPLDAVQKVIGACLENRTYDAYDIIIKLLNNGYNASDILDILLKVVAFNQLKELPKTTPGIKFGSLDPEIQIGFLKAINQSFFLVETTGSITHLYYLISQMIMIAQTKKIYVRSNII